MMPDSLTLVAGILAVGGAFIFYACWRCAPHPRYGWWAAATIFVTTSSLAAPRMGLVQPSSPAWEELTSLGVGLFMLALVLISGRARRVWDPLVLGLALGVLGVTVRVGINSAPILNLPRPWLTVLAGAVMLVHLAFLAALMRLPIVHGWTRARVIPVVLMVMTADLTTSPMMPWWWADWVAAICELVGAALFLALCLTTLRDLLQVERSKAEELNRQLAESEAQSHLDKERLHEIRSTIAGITHATAMIRDRVVEEATAERLSAMVRSELGRLERLLDRREPGSPEWVDLDATIDPLLEIHRARGRLIRWEPTGTTVRGRPDDIAEVLNILLDNSATHAGDTESSIDVTDDGQVVAIRVTDNGPGVAAEVRDVLFDWGAHSSSSAGQGIGLHVGRRLLVEQGGSLTLDQDCPSGASFVMRLPAARTVE